MKKQNLVYVNKEIESEENDYIGFSAQVDDISSAIEEGASMIGVIADYGSGKSSLGELLSKREKIQNPIRVNMWDSLKKDKNDPDEDELITLDKSFLYQIAYNSGNKGLARHVNKRLNKNNGFISFTLKSWKFWLFFAAASLLIIAGILLQASNFSFSIGKYKINNQIYIILYFIAAVVLLIGLRNGSIAFSSWKSEGDKKFDSSDVFSIFSEIVDVIKIKKGKRIIIVEDLDRLEKNDREILYNFIKEVYRFSNLSKQYGIVFVISIKPAAQIFESKFDKDSNLDYDKIFDFIVELRPIHIDDFKAILTSLLYEKKDAISELFAVEDATTKFAEFTILIRGLNLNIRTLKHRLNTALTLFKSLKNKNKGIDKASIDMRTCCVVAYLQSQYPISYNK